MLTRGPGCPPAPAASQHVMQMWRCPGAATSWEQLTADIQLCCSKAHPCPGLEMLTASPRWSLPPSELSICSAPALMSLKQGKIIRDRRYWSPVEWASRREETEEDQQILQYLLLTAELSVLMFVQTHGTCQTVSSTNAPKGDSCCFCETQVEPIRPNSALIPCPSEWLYADCQQAAAESHQYTCTIILPWA